MSFERFKWRGVRRDDLVYAALDHGGTGANARSTCRGAHSDAVVFPRRASPGYGLAVYLLEGLPNAVKVGIVGLLLILFLALLLYLQARTSGREK